MLLVWCVFSSIRDRLGSVWWSVIVRLQSLISRHWTKFHGSVAQWCSKSYGSFGNLEFSLWWPGNLSIYCMMILWWYMLLYVYLYKEELSSSDIWWQVKTDLRLCHSYNHKAGHSQYSTFSHGYSMTSKTSLADVAWMYCTWTWLWMSFSPWRFWNLTTHLQHKSRWRMVAQSSCCHETFESEQLKYFKIWDRRKDWVEMHLIIRCR